jgi:hypothetical protein
MSSDCCSCFACTLGVTSKTTGVWIMGANSRCIVLTEVSLLMQTPQIVGIPNRNYGLMDCIILHAVVLRKECLQAFCHLWHARACFLGMAMTLTRTLLLPHAKFARIHRIFIARLQILMLIARNPCALKNLESRYMQIPTKANKPTPCPHRGR